MNSQVKRPAPPGRQIASPHFATEDAPLNFAAGSAPSSLAVGDFNGDQVPDLAVANGGSDSVSVLLANGDGTFRAPVPVCAGSGPASVAVGRLQRRWDA